MALYRPPSKSGAHTTWQQELLRGSRRPVAASSAYVGAPYAQQRTAVAPKVARKQSPTARRSTSPPGQPEVSQTLTGLRTTFAGQHISAVDAARTKAATLLEHDFDASVGLEPSPETTATTVAPSSSSADDDFAKARSLSRRRKERRREERHGAKERRGSRDVLGAVSELTVAGYSDVSSRALIKNENPMYEGGNGSLNAPRWRTNFSELAGSTDEQPFASSAGKVSVRSTCDVCSTTAPIESLSAMKLTVESSAAAASRARQAAQRVQQDLDSQLDACENRAAQVKRMRLQLAAIEQQYEEQERTLAARAAAEAARAAGKVAAGSRSRSAWEQHAYPSRSLPKADQRRIVSELNRATHLKETKAQTDIKQQRIVAAVAALGNALRSALEVDLPAVGDNCSSRPSSTKLIDVLEHLERVRGSSDISDEAALTLRTNSPRTTSKCTGEARWIDPPDCQAKASNSCPGTIHSVTDTFVLESSTEDATDEVTKGASDGSPPGARDLAGGNAPRDTDSTIDSAEVVEALAKLKELVLAAEVVKKQSEGQAWSRVDLQPAREKHCWPPPGQVETLDISLSQTEPGDMSRELSLSLALEDPSPARTAYALRTRTPSPSNQFDGPLNGNAYGFLDGPSTATAFGELYPRSVASVSLTASAAPDDMAYTFDDNLGLQADAMAAEESLASMIDESTLHMDPDPRLSKPRKAPQTVTIPPTPDKNGPGRACLSVMQAMNNHLARTGALGSGDSPGQRFTMAGAQTSYTPPPWQHTSASGMLLTPISQRHSSPCRMVHFPPSPQQPSFASASFQPRPVSRTGVSPFRQQRATVPPTFPPTARMATVSPPRALPLAASVPRSISPLPQRQRVALASSEAVAKAPAVVTFVGSPALRQSAASPIRRSVSPQPSQLAVGFSSPSPTRGAMVPSPSAPMITRASSPFLFRLGAAEDAMRPPLVTLVGVKVQ